MRRGRTGQPRQAPQRVRLSLITLKMSSVQPTAGPDSRVVGE